MYSAGECGNLNNFSVGECVLIDRDAENEVPGCVYLNNDMGHAPSAKLVKDPTNKACVASSAPKNPSWRKVCQRRLFHPSNNVLERIRESQVEGMNPPSDGDSVKHELCLDQKQTR